MIDFFVMSSYDFSQVESTGSESFYRKNMKRKKKWSSNSHRLFFWWFDLFMNSEIKYSQYHYFLLSKAKKSSIASFLNFSSLNFVRVVPNYSDSWRSSDEKPSFYYIVYAFKSYWSMLYCYYLLLSCDKFKVFFRFDDF